MAVVLMMAAAAMFVVGVVTLSNSQEGEAVGVDTRPRVQLPSTSNALLALTDEDGELASVVVMTLLPEGRGGSVVTVPVNADAHAHAAPLSSPCPIIPSSSRVPGDRGRVGPDRHPQLSSRSTTSNLSSTALRCSSMDAGASP